MYELGFAINHPEIGHRNMRVSGALRCRGRDRSNSDSYSGRFQVLDRIGNRAPPQMRVLVLVSKLHRVVQRC